MEDTEPTTPHGRNKTKGFNINFDDILGADDGEPVANLVVVRSAERERRRKPPPDDEPTTVDDDDVDPTFLDKSDADLKAQIDRLRTTLSTTGPRLPDKGAKCADLLRRADREQQRRQQRCRSQEVADECKNSVQGSSRVNGVLEVPKPESSKFANLFMKKLEGDQKPELEQNTTKYSGKAKNAFDGEISSLSRCDNQKRKASTKLSTSKGVKPGPIAENFSAWERSKDSHKRHKYGPLNLLSRSLSKENQAGSFTAKAVSKSLSSSSLNDDKDAEMNWKEGPTVVLVDEEEPELVAKKQEVDEQSVRPNVENKIYYPSKEDPESLEIFHSELKCLEPGECLTSTIMNFYIRFLGETCSKADRLKQNFYFFNTYFYSKLQEAVARQKGEREAFFTKFRRWWKGVNIFEKAYIFLPINEDNHWSLVIICIPGEEGSRLMILHLDSLRLHFSTTIFDNIKRLLLNEWEYLKDHGGHFDVPIPDKIWEHLPRKFSEKQIDVPRQSNDYDCGLFVLYYMERFIKDAPPRLKEEDISKFGKKWFKSQEASSLRGNIKRILKEKFREVAQENDAMWKPICLPADPVTPKTVHCVDS